MADTPESVEAPADVAKTLEDNDAELAEALETLATLQQTGTLEDLASMADMMALLTAAMDDEMVTELTSTGSRLGEVVQTAGEDDVAGGLEDALAAVGDASAAEPERVGLIGLLRAMRDPEVQAGMGFVIALARALGQRQAETPSE
jgi:uncharacterized protein YjgD (DUF1641 family)